jgi:periplasmic iron binding protein
MHLPRPAYLVLAITIASVGHGRAAEFHVGGPETKNGLEIVGNYLTGIEMDPMPTGAAMGPEAVHLEVDIHAAKDEAHGFREDAWVPYLTITYAIEKVGSEFKKTGQLLPMTAGDGPHYANNISMGGPGEYRVSYLIEPPSKAGFIRHVDQATGVPEWWAPFTVEWTFTYPSQEKK